MKAVIYSRVSTDEQAKEGVSLDNQLQKCRLQAEINDFTIIDEIQDAGRSAKSIQGREGLNQVITLVKSKKINAVIIYKLDRLTRNVSDLNMLIQLFNKYNVSLISVRDSLDTQSASGRMVINLLGVISQWERETISERTSEAMSYLKSQGRKVSKHIPFGYRMVDNVIVKDEAEWEVVERIHAMREGGASFPEIAKAVNDTGLKPREGGTFQFYTVRKIYLRTKTEFQSKMVA